MCLILKEANIASIHLLLFRRTTRYKMLCNNKHFPCRCIVNTRTIFQQNMSTQQCLFGFRYGFSFKKIFLLPSSSHLCWLALLNAWCFALLAGWLSGCLANRLSTSASMEYYRVWDKSFFFLPDP